MQSVLLDAGPMIALFAADDRNHERIDNLISDLSSNGLRLMTTWPCVVEACFLLGVPERYELLRWIELGGVVVYPFSSDDLKTIAAAMKKYTQVGRAEMDLADATLYWLATETGCRDIITTDVRDFTRYRLPDRSTFNFL